MIGRVKSKQYIHGFIDRCARWSLLFGSWSLSVALLPASSVSFLLTFSDEPVLRLDEQVPPIRL